MFIGTIFQFSVSKNQSFKLSCLHGKIVNMNPKGLKKKQIKFSTVYFSYLTNLSQYHKSVGTSVPVCNA